MEKKYIRFDGMKLIVLVLLLFILAALFFLRSKGLIRIEGLIEIAPTPPELEAEKETTTKNKLPVFPAGAENLTFNEENSGLIDGGKNIIYTLSDDGTAWIPKIGTDLKNQLPEPYQVEKDENDVWQIINESNEAIYIFDAEQKKWLAVEKQETKGDEDAISLQGIVECPLANPSQISSEGKMIRVINAIIPLRSSPDATTLNFVTSLEQETQLEVIGEPVCTPYLEGANIWWPVRTPNGMEGYAAEGSAISDLYYLEEIGE